MKQIDGYWDKEIQKKYFEGLDMKQFKIISEISYYDHNYYVGFDGNLLYAHSDDDNTTEWYLVYGDREPKYLGLSYTSNHDKLVYESNL